MNDKPQTNTEIRQWYLQQTLQIPELNKQWLADGLSPEERARAAWRVRHEAGLKAREMMSEPEDVRLLQARDIALYGTPDGPTFDFLIEQLENEGIKENDIYEAIILGSYRTNEGINKKLGV